MSDPRRDFSKLGFVKTFVLPGVLVFLIPIITLFFFLHAQSRFDADAREEILAQIRADAGLSPEEREKAVAFINEHPFSELVRNEAFGAQVDPKARFDYATFRWMILLAVASIVAGIGVFALGGICVLLSRQSQRALHLSLSAGWQLLRIYGAIQVVVQGAMVLALSYWVTALWMHVYYPKLILIAGLLAVIGAFAVIKAIFKKPETGLQVDGVLLDPAGSPRLWADLGAICEQVGTAPPDNVIVGIDDNFFATEAPVSVGGTTCRGRTLYVSLALLKQMDGAEADAVLAHEMAHFSGNDTLYSKKISPLLARYAQYLQALAESPLARPIFHFMNGFRALFELSLGAHSRSREFRADRIATEVTSPHDFAGALLRVSAYSDFRRRIQDDLFDKDHVLGAANISERLEEGFHEHARSFAAKPDLGDVATAHPFDSHPPLAQRLEAIGVPLRSQDIPSLVASPGDGRWFDAIDGAEQIEDSQWKEFEDNFRSFHEGTLAYRFLPETDEERAIVTKAFPGFTVEGKKGSLTVDCDTIHYSEWLDKLAFSEVSGISLHEHTLRVNSTRDDMKKLTIPMKTFGQQEAEAIQAVQIYYNRYMTAVAYRNQKLEGQGPIAG